MHEKENKDFQCSTYSAKNNLLYGFPWNFSKLFILQTLDTSKLVTRFIKILLFIDNYRILMEMTEIQDKNS